MRSDGIVVPSPVLDQHLSFTQRCEDLAVEKFVPEFRVQALAVAVLPGASWFDIERLYADPAEPVSYILGDELGAIV